MSTGSLDCGALEKDGALSEFRRALLRWYDENRRNLPWRKTRNPYRIWISEVMLQQTRVAAVLDHYRLFLKRFPSVRILAAASGNDVLAAWSGLGYYRRARRLHLCAKNVVREHAGRFPKTAAELRTLPGIGRYTAAAIASIAFGEPTAVVDGNVERVLGRLVHPSIAGKDRWEFAERLLTIDRPGDHNQAMMELGATVCLPRQPNCSACPVRRWCRTQNEIVRDRPSPNGRRSAGAARAVEAERRAPSPGGQDRSFDRAPGTTGRVKKQICCSLERRDGHIRLVRRAKLASLMPGMWELPQFAKSPQDASESSRWRIFRHSITVTDYTVHVARDHPTASKGKWVGLADVRRLPLTGLTRKILKAEGVI